MDAKQIAERQIIERYLAGQLSEEDAQAFEFYVEAHPAMIREIEIVARMKSGLTTLKKRGELGALLEPAAPAWYARGAIIAALAASVAVVAFIIARPLEVDRPGALMAATVQELPGERGGVATVSSRISLSRVRGIVPPELARQQGGTAIAIILRTSTVDSGVPHTVSLIRISGGSLEPLATAGDVRADSDGYLEVFVSASVLAEGTYLFRVASDGREPQDFALRVTGAID